MIPTQQSDPPWPLPLQPPPPHASPQPGAQHTVPDGTPTTPSPHVSVTVAVLAATTFGNVSVMLFTQGAIFESSHSSPDAFILLVQQPAAPVCNAIKSRADSGPQRC
jgi:hypothetical protein